MAGARNPNHAVSRFQKSIPAQEPDEISGRHVMATRVVLSIGEGASRVLQRLLVGTKAASR